MAQYFFGPDTYGARQALDESARVLSARLRFLDKDALEKANFSDLLAQSTRGLFGRELIVVRDPSLFPESLQDILIAAYKANPTAEWIAWDRVPPKKKTSFWKAFQKAKREFPYPAEGALVSWLVGEAKGQGSVLEVVAAQELVVRVGQDRWQLLQELAKLCAVHQSISLQQVRAAVPEAGAQANVFRMLDALARGDSALALEELGAALVSGEPEFRLLAMLAYQLKVIFLITAATGRSSKEIAAEVGLHPFVVEKNMRLARRISPALVTDMYTRLLATDFSIKQGVVDARTGLTMLVLGLAQTLAPQKVS